MKSKSIVIFRLASMCLFTCVARCDEASRKAAEMLVKSYPDWHSNQAYAEKWRLEVKSKNGVTSDLIEMIKEEKDWELVGGIFTTLRERDDVTPEMLEDLKKPLNDILSKVPHSDMLSSSYAYGVIGLLSNFPTSENEKLLLSLLGKHDGYYNLGVFPSLAAIGTAESLPTMKKMLADFNYPSGGGGDVVVSLENAVKSIEKRINAGERQAASKNRRRDASPDSENNGGNVSTETNFDPKQKSSDDRKSMSQWPVWGGLVLGGMILLLKFIQKRSI